MNVLYYILGPRKFIEKLERMLTDSDAVRLCFNGPIQFRSIGPIRFSYEPSQRRSFNVKFKLQASTPLVIKFISIDLRGILHLIRVDVDVHRGRNLCLSLSQVALV